MNIWNIQLNCGRKISVLLSSTSFSVLYNVGSELNEILEWQFSQSYCRAELTGPWCWLFQPPLVGFCREWRAYISTLQLYNRHPLKRNSFLVVEMWLGSQKAKWCLATVISWIREKTPFHGCTLERAYSSLGHLFDKGKEVGRDVCSQTWDSGKNA